MYWSWGAQKYTLAKNSATLRTVTVSVESVKESYIITREDGDATFVLEEVVNTPR